MFGPIPLSTWQICQEIRQQFKARGRGRGGKGEGRGRGRGGQSAGPGEKRAGGGGDKARRGGSGWEVEGMYEGFVRGMCGTEGPGLGEMAIGKFLIFSSNSVLFLFYVIFLCGSRSGRDTGFGRRQGRPKVCCRLFECPAQHCQG